MSRYFYYPIIVCMLINTIIYVPKVLMEARFTGAITAMLIAIPLGTLLAFIFAKAMNRFPGKGLPEILKAHTPSWIRIPILLFLGFMWFSAGSIVLVSYALITKRFINPDLQMSVLLVCFILVGRWSATRSSESILNVMEILIVLSSPLVMFISYKAFTSESFDWDAILVFTDYAFKTPSLMTLAAATYLFTGYVCLAVFHRFFQESKPIRYFWVIPIIGFLVCFTTFFIPIGLHGTQAVEKYVYVWVSTADSLNMKYGFIERVLFVFLMLYIMLCLLFIALTWHIATELIRSVSTKESLLVKWLIVACIGMITYIYGSTFNEKQLTHLAEQWLILRLFAELGLVGLIIYISRRKKHAS